MADSVRVYLGPRLIEAIDARVGKEWRAKFIRDAVAEKLEREAGQYVTPPNIVNIIDPAAGTGAFLAVIGNPPFSQEGDPCEQS